MQPSPSIDYHQLPHIYVTEGFPTGKRTIILGEAEKGTLYDPVPITSVGLAKAIFGSGPLVDRYEDLTTGAKVGSYLMRIESNALQKAYRALIKFPFDLIYIDGVYFNAHPEEISNFIDFAKDKEYEGQLIHGFFDVKDLDSMDSIRTIYPSIAALSHSIEDGIDEWGKYISVVFDQVIDHRSAAVYAGLVASLNPEISPINKTLPVKLKQELKKDDILELRKAGIVCFKDSLKKGVVCTSSSCAVATEDSGSKHISNLRIAQYLIQEIALVLQEYVGRVGINYVVMEVEGIIQSKLEEYIMLNRIKRFDYGVMPDKLRGIINVEIEIVPVFSVYAITQSSQVQVRK